MTALFRRLDKFIRSVIQRPVAEARLVHRTRAGSTAPDFEKLRADAMKRFPKTRAYLAK